jgi:ribosomal protein S27E
MRFDPAVCEGNCPVCGAGVGTPTGGQTTIHQRQGTRETCPGSGQPAL